MSKPITVRVKAIAELTPRIRQFTLVPNDAAAELPRFTAGAHVSVETKDGSERQYSLCNDPDEVNRYVIAVLHEQDGRGGSRWMHERVNVGSILTIKPPLNNFPLAEGAKQHLLIAGGIGITPILAMTRVLSKQTQPFKTIYLSRSKSEAAFLDVLLSAAFADHTHVHHDFESKTFFDLASALKSPAEGTHIYCCGPSGLMTAVENLTKEWPSETVHFERFANEIASHQSGDRPFTVKLAKKGLTVDVAADQTILDALLAHGIDVDYSCCEGTCGTCITKVLEGVADHRDAVLTDQEKSSLIAICCSRAKSETLVLDL